MSQIPEIFRYSHPKTPDDCTDIVSPSAIYKFFSLPKIWYEEYFLNKKQFEATTATVVGTICHHIYEKVAKGENVVREEIEKQLREYVEMKNLTEVDVDKVIADYVPVVNTVVNAYVLPHTTGYGNIELEKPVAIKLPSNYGNGVYLAGTIDRIEGDCIVDYKNVAVKPNELQIPFNYKIQLLAYAYAARQLGYEINRIRIVYGVKPTKTLGARCVVVTETISFPDEQMVDDTLKLMADTILFSKKFPEYNYLIFKSYALKE